MPFGPVTLMLNGLKSESWPRNLSQFNYICAPVHVKIGPGHWCCMFIDLLKEQFFYIDPLVLDQSVIKDKFKKWCSFAKNRSGLKNVKDWQAILDVQYPRQSGDDYNCGVWICIYLTNLLINQVDIPAPKISLNEYRDKILCYLIEDAEGGQPPLPPRSKFLTRKL